LKVFDGSAEERNGEVDRLGISKKSRGGDAVGSLRVAI